MQFPKERTEWEGNLTQLMASPNLMLDARPVRQKNQCHGPVTDLGQMVSNQWWKTVFSDSLYLKTDGDVVEDPSITRQEVALLENIPAIKAVLLKGSTGHEQDPHGRILDLCCGQGRHALYLAREYPHLAIHGHDQSSYLISLAVERASFQNAQQTAVFTVGDCRAIPYPDNSFDLVILMGNSFGYFAEDEQDVAVLAEVRRILSPGGILQLDLTDGGHMRSKFEQRSWEWADSETFVCRERQLSKDSLRLISREIITVTHTGVVRDQFYQERLYSRKELCTLLDSQGFKVAAESLIQGNVTIANQSKRNEDLGMMAHRMFITSSLAEADTEADLATETSPVDSAIHIPPPMIENMCVLLGDPSKQCVGKLNNSWNVEDMETRRKFVEALVNAGVSSNAFQVVDKHETLHAYLMEKKPTFVFNLCDEGWNNDALQELHIPALLETLSIPYSGAGPNCLAYCYDKGLVNRSAEALGIATPKELTFLGRQPDLILETRVKTDIGFPAFIKPIKGDNSLGITTRSIVCSIEQVSQYMEELYAANIVDVLVQEYLQGTEYGVGMIGNAVTGFEFLPILEVDYSRILDKNLPPILGYESKWDPLSPYWTDISFKQTKLEALEQEKLKKTCKLLWERFGCRDYARFDFRSDTAGVIKLLEVNPNPGWCWDGKLAYMAKLGGYTYSDLLNMILKTAYERLKL